MMQLYTCVEIYPGFVVRCIVTLWIIDFMWTFMMDKAMALLDMEFRTYINVNTREFKTTFYTKAPLKSFRPPEEWDFGD